MDKSVKLSIAVLIITLTGLGVMVYGMLFGSDWTRITATNAQGVCVTQDVYAPEALNYDEVVTWAADPANAEHIKPAIANCGVATNG